MEFYERMHGTTILCVRKNGRVAIGGDGQVSMGATIVKGKANKIRTLRDGEIVCGFAGATADAFALLERFEAKLEQYNGNLRKSAIELCKDWRTDRYLRRLEAVLITVDKDTTLMISGTGDVLEPDGGVIATGSGGPYALAAALALNGNTELDARETVLKALEIAADICIYTNTNFTIEEL